MTIIPSILLAVLFITALGIVLLVLFQNKGGNIGSAFGGGSNTVFGARGAGDFLTRTTAIFATVFFLSALALAAYYNTNNPQASSNSVINSATTTTDGTNTEADEGNSGVPVIPE